MADPGEKQPYLSMVAPWQRLDSTPLLQTRVFRVRKQDARSPTTGRTAPFFVIDCADWVNVIALDNAGRIVMVEQYRHGTDSITLEIPGGMVDPGEDALAAGLRELQEESGYRPGPQGRAMVIGMVEPNPAIQSNRCATVLVDGVVPGEAAPDEHEELGLRLVDAAAVAGLIRDGVITHALVVAAFHHLHLHEGVPTP